MYTRLAKLLSFALFITITIDCEAVPAGVNSNKSSHVIGKIARNDIGLSIYDVPVNTNFDNKTAKLDNSAQDLVASNSPNSLNIPQPRVSKNNKVILFIWDGLRPDVVSETNTPNLYKLKQQGSFFSDHHSIYPTVTMNNANSFATGNYAGQTGFYGNKSWRPDLRDVLKGKMASAFLQPIFAQSLEVLDALDQSQIGEPLMYVDTLLQVARKYGLKTAQVGKYGPVALQDANKPSVNGFLVSDKKIYPLDFAKSLAKKGYALPSDVVNQLNAQNKNAQKINTLISAAPLELRSIDGKIPLVGLSNPADGLDDITRDYNNFYMDVYLKEILTTFKPDVSIIWLTSPDGNAHRYGSGTKSFYQSLRNQDLLLGKLLLSLEKLGLKKTTNLIVASDHGHSNVAADFKIFPLREIKNSSIGEKNSEGYSVSGMIRIASLLSEAGIKAYDGLGCDYNPVLYGMLSDRSFLQSVKADKDAKVCGDGAGRLYTTASFYVPAKIPKDAVVVANNNGSAYLYLPDHDQNLATKVVRLLQSRPEFDSIFIDDRYGDLAGTLPLQSVKFYDSQKGRHPDILVALSYDEKQIVNGLPGTSYAVGDIFRGTHGTLSPLDIKNVFVASGPDFKTTYQDLLPTSNVDVPVTIAYLLNLPFDNRDGRAVLEAIKGSGVKASDYELKLAVLQPNKPATNLQIPKLTSLNGRELVDNQDSFTFALNTKQLSIHGSEYLYIDSGKAMRY